MADLIYMPEPPDIRDHSDYVRGFRDRWNGVKEPKDNFAIYMAGWAAVEEVECAFKESGFEDSGGVWTKATSTRDACDRLLCTSP